MKKISQKITIIGGAGSMGRAFANCFVKSGIPPKQITLTRKSAWGNEMGKFKRSQDNVNATKGADIIILAVEPSAFNEVIEEISSIIKTNQILISIVTGKSIGKIEGAFWPKKPTIIRAMPNTAIEFAESMTLVSFSIGNNNFSNQRAVKILERCGKVEIVSEPELSIGTVFTGSMPAFLSYFINPILELAEEQGFEKEKARNIISQVMLGTSVILRNGYEPGKIITRVATKRGCTENGLLKFTEGKVKSGISAGVSSSLRKVKRMSK